jgi:nickel-dependent lactate racemase
MKIDLPYKSFPFVEIPDKKLMAIYGPPEITYVNDEQKVIKDALHSPFGTPKLGKLVKNKKHISIIVDDISRPTPVYKIVPYVLEELIRTGVKKSNINFIFALGTHRPMTKKEMIMKLGKDIVDEYRVFNHDWKNKEELVFVGNVMEKVPVFVNKKVYESDFIIGIGRIMPIDVCGYTGGGKIVIPGVCGEETVNEMHWQRVYYNSDDIKGKRDNIVMKYIDSISKKIGLAFVLNVVMDDNKRILSAVAGDPIAAHKEGVSIAKKVHEVNVHEKSDIIVTYSYPFDKEFWQANKALDNVGNLLKDGGVVILIAPCYEGFSPVHNDDILRIGYRSKKEIIQLVENGELKTKVVGVHLAQVAEVKDRATIILVTNHISRDIIEKVGFTYAEDPNRGLYLARSIIGRDKKILFVNNASTTIFHVKN